MCFFLCSFEFQGVFSACGNALSIIPRPTEGLKILFPYQQTSDKQKFPVLARCPQIVEYYVEATCAATP